MINKKNKKKSKDQESYKKVIVIKTRENLRKLSTGSMDKSFWSIKISDFLIIFGPNILET